jgi:DNA-binding transcriptional MerR regulator
LKKIPTLTIESVLKLKDRDLNVKTELDVNFPRKATPKVFCIDSIRSPIVKPETGEINYSAFFTWDGNSSKIHMLLKSIQNYLNANPPQQSKELELIKKVINNAREILGQKIKNFNVEKFKASLSPEEAKLLYDADKNYDILMKSDEIKEIKKYMASILYKTLQYIGYLIRGD